MAENDIRLLAYGRAKDGAMKIDLFKMPKYYKTLTYTLFELVGEITQKFVV
jgi:hypothetical protein